MSYMSKLLSWVGNLEELESFFEYVVDVILWLIRIW